LRHPYCHGPANGRHVPPVSPAGVEVLVLAKLPDRPASAGLGAASCRAIWVATNAIEILREEGLVFTVPRRGTYVSPGTK
jgi:hypothetical protein